MTLPYDEGYFDCIIYGDVLEHLVNPWGLLREHNRLLRRGGVIICSIPNILYFKVTSRLVYRGRWEYEDEGVLDRTHLRFFTRPSMERMIADAGFVTTRMIRKPSCASWPKWLTTLTGNLLIDHLVRKYIFVAVKDRSLTE